jgi:hypothetical protein
MNMSGMNGNLAAQSGSLGEKMKLLIYGLGTVPVELLFSECERLSRADTDSWIPLEVVPETFHGEHVLRLGTEGFTFHRQKGDEPLVFYTVSRSVDWQDEIVLSVSDDPGEEERRYIAKAVTSSSAVQPPPTSRSNGWCILFEGDVFDDRAARFVISRRRGNKVFLHFDCPLRLSRVDENDQKQRRQLPSDTGIARLADSSVEFIIERSPTPESLSIARPQNPSQYSDRLIVIGGFLYYGSGYLERRFLTWCLGAGVEEDWRIFPFSLVYSMLKLRWIERGLEALVHRAWLETFSPTWSPSGPWRWFWKASNYEPPVPFKTINKWLCQFTFTFFCFWAPIQVWLWLLYLGFRCIRWRIYWACT